MTRPDLLRLPILFGLLPLLLHEPLHAQDWIRATGIPGIPIIAVVGHESGLFALSLDSVYRSTDNGLSWSLTPVQPGLAADLMSLATSGIHVYLGTTDKGVLRTSDGGKQWEDCSQGLPGSGVPVLCAVGDTVYAGTEAHGIFVLNSGRASAWTPLNDGLTQVGARTIGFGHGLLLATVGGSVYARRQGEPSWTEILLDSARGQLPVNDFARLGEYLFAGVGIGVYRGSSDGRAWRKTGILQLPNMAVEHLATYGTRLLAGIRYRLEHFIAYTDDAGGSWTVQHHQLSELLNMEVIGSRLWACRADGLWSLPLSPPTDAGGPLKDLPASYQLGPNFPNPFNPGTTIRYGVPEGSHVTMAVFNLLGQRVAELVNGEVEAGYHEVRFVARDLPSGVYFYRLQAGSRMLTRSLCVVK